MTESSLDQLGIPEHLRHFAPTAQAALARVEAIDLGEYARTRNALNGAVTGLSPYLTHGVLSVPQVLESLKLRLQGSGKNLRFEDKLCFELAWREFFQHVWARVEQPEDILQDMRPMDLWRGEYAPELPADVRQGATGVPAIDAAVRQLYATGYLHNHARMWLASYCVHLRKVHWRAGADWLYTHLLDGDLVSNHLSWQWVASSFSSKPYLFNAANVAKFAPPEAWRAWASPKTAIDLSYEELDVICRERSDVGAEPGQHAQVAEPAAVQPDAYIRNSATASVFIAQSAIEYVAKQVQERPMQQAIELVHPWALSDVPVDVNNQPLRIGLLHLPFFKAHPWSEQRLAFVCQRMSEVCDVVWVGDAVQLAQIPGWPLEQAVAPQGRAKVYAQETLNPEYRQALQSLAQPQPAPRWLPSPKVLCQSFTKFYTQAQRLNGKVVI